MTRGVTGLLGPDYTGDHVKNIFFSLLQAFNVLQGQRTTSFFRHEAIKHILPGPGEDWLSTHIRVETMHHRTMACGYQQLLAKCQGNSKLSLGSKEIIFPFIKGGKKFRRSQREGLCHRDDLESNTDILHLYGYVILETPRANLVPNKDKLP